MAAPNWLEAVAQQAEEVSARLRDVLSSGVGLLRSELGLPLPAGLEPQHLPTWLVLLSTSLLALLLLLGLLWAAACARGGDARRKPSRRAAEVGDEEEEDDDEEDEDEEDEVTSATPGLTGGGGVSNKGPPGTATTVLLKGEEQKKRNKKKAAEKTGRLNGQPAHDVSEEIIQTTRKENLKQTLDMEKKTEKSKKNRKKTKGDAKTAQDQSRGDGKEADEGAWETKISNREKRQQRKRDKVLTDAGSESNLPSLEIPVTVSSEQIIASAIPFSVGPRKNKGDPVLNVQISNSKSGKGDAALQPGMSEGPTVNGGNWNEKPVKIAPQIGASEEKWTAGSSAGSKRKTETSAWGKDAGDNGNGKDWGVSLVGRTWGERTLFPGIAWSGVDGRINTPEQSSASFTPLGLNPTVSDGLSSADPTSDWNAPAEEWGNWVEEENPPSIPQLEEALSETQKPSDEEKEKPEAAQQNTASGKSKKKKKKKKKQGEEANSPIQESDDLERHAGEEFPEDTSKVQQVEITFSLKTINTSEQAEPKEMPSFAVSTELSVPVSESDSEKIISQVPQMLQEAEVIKQNSVPPPQTKSEESWESPKQIKKKKKARRET
ncbi:PREDICTED: protein LYRIC isoform X2 [Thamnophis sirtalis]|uniref:Protein LYRIC isoform X2 n=1 Tax=Thamnophis sirtalis TaxID=35019 RepID=A0A6I9YJ34_9SAUR|nr:PREDICTED: protein LYRIC isoform X2 [Thamnophis sirtalis]